MLVAVEQAEVGDFYPRPPRGGRLRPDGLGVKLLPISIHVLREEDDRARGC